MIFVNILAYTCRDDNREIVQPTKIVYTKPPMTVRTDKFSAYDVQLPRVAELEPDWDSDLYCWLYTLWTAHSGKKSVEEVIAMTPQLQNFTADSGFAQFRDRLEILGADEEFLDDYYRWYAYQMEQADILEAAKAAGKAESDRFWSAQLAAERKAVADRDAKLAEYEKRFGKI